MNQKLLLSIIIPIYNSEKYLPELIESIQAQEFSDYELIIIDDGSIDGSLEICRNFKIKNNNIKIISQKNKGVSTARNKGLDEVSGEYVLFLDSDDYLTNSALKIIEKYLTEQKPDMFLFNFHVLRSNNSYIHLLDERYKDIQFLTNRQAIESLFSGKGYQGFVWNKIYKYDIIKKNQFNANVHYLEDFIFNIDIINIAQNILCIREPLIYYRQHNESTVASFDNRHLTYLSALDIVKNKIPAYFSEEILGRKLLAYITFAAKSYSTNKKIYREMRQRFNEEKDKVVFNNSNYKKIEKNLLVIGYYSFEVAVVIYSVKSVVVKNRLYYKLKNRHKR